MSANANGGSERSVDRISATTASISTGRKIRPDQVGRDDQAGGDWKVPRPDHPRRSLLDARDFRLGVRRSETRRDRARPVCHDAKRWAVTPTTMDECSPRFRITVTPGDPAQTALCVALGTGFTLVLFMGMAHFSMLRRAFRQPRSRISGHRPSFEPPPPRRWLPRIRNPSPICRP